MPGSQCGGLAGRSLRGTEREMYIDVQRNSDQETYLQRERERFTERRAGRKRERVIYTEMERE